MKELGLLLVSFLIFIVNGATQISISTDGTLPHGSAMLEVKSNSKGFLLPRMTYNQLLGISAPAEGLQVFCTDCGSNGLGALSIFMAGHWYYFITNCLPPLQPASGTPAVTPVQIIWNWNDVTGATGYKWNTVNDYASASDMGVSTTKTETGLTPNTTYSRYVWAYSSCGASAVTTLTGQTSPYAIGMNYGGGIVFYIDGSGNHGLIAATSDQGVAPWGCFGGSIGTSTAIGSGQANTTAIVNGCGTVGIAARICYDLVLNNYSDWFLPSRDELNKMYLQKTVIGGFTSSVYWSSSETGAYAAWILEFAGGAQNSGSKYDSYYVRAIRAF